MTNGIGSEMIATHNISGHFTVHASKGTDPRFELDHVRHKSKTMGTALSPRVNKTYRSFPSNSNAHAILQYLSEDNFTWNK